MRGTLAALGLIALMARGGAAAAIETASTTAADASTSLKAEMAYGTSGQIGLTGITGPNVISFIPEAAGSVTSPSAFSLGTFVVGYLPPGVTTKYDNTPFSITYSSLKVNGEEPKPNEGPITITGFLNGTITGPSQSDVVATFNTITKPTFVTGSYLNKLSVLDPQVSLVPSTTNAGRTTAQGHLRVSPAPIPEPTTIALFATAIAGLGLRRRAIRRARLG